MDTVIARILEGVDGPMAVKTNDNIVPEYGTSQPAGPERVFPRKNELESVGSGGTYPVLTTN